MGAVQSLIRAIYPPHCLTCSAVVGEEGGLCATCWRDTPFVSGLVCDLCGTPLPGESDAPVHCDDCLTIARPWAQGRAALLYRDNGRRLVLALKHGDRTDLAPAAARWMLAAAGGMARAGTLVAPVPLHWRRLVRRRYNQSALLARAVAAAAGLSQCPDLMRRTRATASQDGRDRAARFANLDGAVTVPESRRALAEGARVLLVDDVMTSGATFAAAAEACLAAGAAEVRVLALARVTKEA
jgi:ComF family protein